MCCPEQYVKPQQGPVNSVSASLSFLEMNPEISVFQTALHLWLYAIWD